MKHVLDITIIIKYNLLYNFIILENPDNLELRDTFPVFSGSRTAPTTNHLLVKLSYFIPKKIY